MTQWQQRPEAGSASGLRILLWIARHLGRGSLHTILLPVSTYFCLVRGPERRASFAYLSRVFGRPARWREVLRHFHEFSTVTADRFFFLAGRADEIPVRFVLDERLQTVLQQDRPGIILAAHFGSFEAARVLGPEMGGFNLHIVLDKALNERFMEIMATLEPQLHSMIIDSQQDSVVLGLNISDVLKAGDWVGFLADRHRAGDRTARQSFLGSPANFPIGPYIIASVFKAPLIAMFCRLTEGGYEVHCELLSDCVRFQRKSRQSGIDMLVADYVKRLEVHVRASPFGWFNFFDFWADDA